ncbi:MAG TPA: class I SAM-dependent methyltransferase [Bacteroidia bacterium]|nr:class I SAM-dependent methyltransferase [Bacteroidia bacterium]HRH06987.1 class I SAM-dependent methyltransferase [Bacteroidia bacterium]HRH63014.1 class I SAM-dependent methyltransferase [Bacteroidia bacterium]
MLVNDTTHSQFDVSAPNYDAEFTTSAIGKMQREQVYFALQVNKLVKSKSKILEINCGTGEDAIWLANHGHSVLATDASEEMIRVAKQKASGLNKLDLQFQQAEFSALNTKYGTQKFDLIFSNFGGLNCVNKTVFKQLMDDFYSLLNPDGKLIFVIMGRKCFWERMYFLFKGNNKKAFRRMSQSAISAELGNGAKQNTFYFSPSEIRSIAEPNFKLLSTKPIGLFVPPSYLNKFFLNKKYLLLFLFQMEKLFSPFSFLSDYADHYLIYLKKK